MSVTRHFAEFLPALVVAEQIVRFESLQELLDSSTAIRYECLGFPVASSYEVLYEVVDLPASHYLKPDVGAGKVIALPAEVG